MHFDGQYPRDPDHFRFANDEFYMKSGDEMAELFPDMPEALDTTLEIADKCNVEISFDERHLPKFPVPKGRRTSRTCASSAKRPCRRGTTR